MNKQILAIIAAISVPALVHAQADQAPPPPPPMPGVDGPNAPDQQGMQPYLGVETSPADPALAAQLKLPAGSGLVVNFVAGQSPAAEAGIQRYDVLTRLDEQVLINPPQLQALIRSKKSGDEIKLTVLRSGQSQTLTAKLTEHEATGAPGFGAMRPPMGFGPGMGMGMGMGRPAIHSLMIGDGQTRLQITNDSGEVKLTATSQDGKKLFDGPVETREQREAMPADVRQMLGDAAIEHLVARMKNAPPTGVPDFDEGGRPAAGPGMGRGMGPGGGMGPGPGRGPGPRPNR